MATKIQNINLETSHFNNFKSYLPGINNCCEFTIDWLLQKGFLQVSTIFEHALAEVGGHTVISTDCADISDGSDAKLVTVRNCNSGKTYSAPVSGIYNKTGSLRVQVYERKQDKFYYFAIPNAAYKTIPKTSNIEIPFELDGTPKRINNCNVNWWNYETKDWRSMAQAINS